jgi:P27 family predicted phage terminase small subunit
LGQEQLAAHDARLQHAKGDPHRRRIRKPSCSEDSFVRGARPELVVIEGGMQDDQPDARHDDLPQPPAAVPAEMHAEWFAIVADLKQRRLLTDSMLGVVRAYVMAQWTAAQAEKSIAEQGVFVPGAGGAMKPNPATGLLRSSRDMISRLAAELGLTPTARSRKALRSATQDAPDLFSAKWDL